MNNKLKVLKDILVITLLLNLAVTVTIDMLRHPQLTDAQIIKRIPHTFFYHFNK